MSWPVALLPLLLEALSAGLFGTGVMAMDKEPIDPLQTLSTFRGYANNVAISPQGVYSYYYSLPDQMRFEERTDSGEVRGKYAFVAPEGDEFQFKYEAGKEGFQVESNALPNAPEDTDEVKKAKQAFFRAYDKALALASIDDDSREISRGVSGNRYKGPIQNSIRGSDFRENEEREEGGGEEEDEEEDDDDDDDDDDDSDEDDESSEESSEEDDHYYNESSEESSEEDDDDDDDDDDDEDEEGEKNANRLSGNSFSHARNFFRINSQPQKPRNYFPQRSPSYYVVPNYVYKQQHLQPPRRRRIARQYQNKRIFRSKNPVVLRRVKT